MWKSYNSEQQQITILDLKTKTQKPPCRTGYFLYESSMISLQHPVSLVCCKYQQSDQYMRHNSNLGLQKQQAIGLGKLYFFPILCVMVLQEFLNNIKGNNTASSLQNIEGTVILFTKSRVHKE